MLPSDKIELPNFSNFLLVSKIETHLRLYLIVGSTVQQKN
jgi:hypothetical protein